MTESQNDALWGYIDQLIEDANQKTEELDIGEVGNALLYAAARFNAFMVAASCETRNDFKEDRSDSQKFLMDQFRQMLLNHFDDYEENFKVYLRQEDDTQGEES